VCSNEITSDLKAHFISIGQKATVIKWTNDYHTANL